MSLPPGEKMDPTARSLLKVTREVDLSQGASAFSKDLTDRIQKAWMDAKADPATNPLYRFHSSMGTELFRRGSRVGAEENFIRAIKFGPDVAKAHIDLGGTQLANHEYADATDEFRKAVKLDGHSKAALSGLAAALVGSGHRDEAIQMLAQNVRLNPSDATAHSNMGVVLVGTPGRLDEGIAELREALRIDPNREPVKHALDAALEAKSKGKN
jgi:tetratricopeptide (TPR) repeat protein